MVPPTPKRMMGRINGGFLENVAEVFVLLLNNLSNEK
jgi:hypothetical protein